MDSGRMKPMRKNSTQMSLLQYTELRPLNGDKTQHAVTSMYLFFSLKRTSCLPTSEAYGKQYMETVEAYDFFFDTPVVVSDTFFVGYHTLGVDGGQHPQCSFLPGQRVRHLYPRHPYPSPLLLHPPRCSRPQPPPNLLFRLHYHPRHQQPPLQHLLPHSRQPRNLRHPQTNH